jgi:hypothetical protein
MKYLIDLMRFDVKNLFKKIFGSNLKWINLICLQLKFVKLFCKYKVILAEHTVASQTSSDITSEFSVITKILILKTNLL